MRISNLLCLGETPLDFYYVPGTEYFLPSTLVNGNPPLPSTPMAIAALVIGVVLLGVVLTLEWRLPWKRLPRRHRVLLRALIVLNFFGVWEAGLQVCAQRYNEPSFVPDPATFWKLNPSLTEAWIKQHDVPPTGSLRGWRTAPSQELVERTKSPGTCRMLFFGESQLVSIDNQEINLSRSYPVRLQALLSKAFPDRTFELINDGVPGFSSWQGLLLLEQHLASRPDVVVFAFGFHDSSRAYARDQDVLTNQPWLHSVRSLLYRSELFLLMRRAAIVARETAEEKESQREHGLPTFRVPLPEFERNLRRLAELGRAQGFQAVFLIQPLRRDCGKLVGVNSVRLYQEAIRRVGREEGVLVIDIFGPMDKLSPAVYSRCWNDAVHMTSLGHEQVARILFDAFVASGLSALEGSSLSSTSPPVSR